MRETKVDARRESTNESYAAFLTKHKAASRGKKLAKERAAKPTGKVQPGL